MKKFVLALIAVIFVGSSYASPSLPPRASINFTLSTIESGSTCPAILRNAKVVVDYDYNFERNMGLAFLRQLDTARWGEVLHPMGLSNYYGFISDMPPTAIQLTSGEVTIYRIIFHLYNNGDSQVSMMIGQDGDCIMSSDMVNVLS
ncbi:hypothetical protein [Legionella fallonii]|uniref:Uncharacterized protein n=1 Tax=Legionella fallonii LLAP-10 TaxID=1212491 RepID=A0A098G6T1_9GAMM|nr:hypothetical protein [Legionella fallonii]CEG57701.1 conserved exported protein of unknown function [Legionella fallonii LLAP-10]